MRTNACIALLAGAVLSLLWVGTPRAADADDELEALHVLRAVAGLEDGAASVDCDTHLDARDALYLLREAAGLPNAECTPPRDIRAQAVSDALAWWVANGDDVTPVLTIPVYWSLVGTVYDGWAGFGSYHQWVAICGECYTAWFGGYAWLVGLLIHEYGHALGYNHGDPVCPMNPDYC